MESKKPSAGLQRFLIDAPPPYSPAHVLERFLEDAKKWPKKMLADAHDQRALGCGAEIDLENREAAYEAWSRYATECRRLGRPGLP